jgi:hypothetical protein
MRRLRLTLIAAAVVVFLAISALLTRALSVGGAERSAITALIEAEAAGNVAAMLHQIDGCERSDVCRARVAADATTLRQPGKVVILELSGSAGFSLSSTVGTTRVAWRAGAALPVVQCVRVRRAGSVLTGLRIQLLLLSKRIRTDADCPARY